MSYITDIRFNRVEKEEGILCEHCGAYIVNIYSIYFDNGFTLRCGSECFKKFNG